MAEETKPLESQAPPPESPPVAPQADDTPPLVKKLAELGFENVTSTEEGVERLISAYKQQQEQFGQQLKDTIAEVRASFAQPATSTPEAPDAKQWWNPPQADLAAASRYRTPDGGWKPETPPDLRQQVEALERYKATFADRLLTDPKSALAPLLEEKFQEFFEQKFGQITAAQREEQFFAKAYAENDWLFEKDPHSGRSTRKLSAEGQRFNELFLEAQDEYGVADPIKAFGFALKLREVERGASANKTVTHEQAAAENERRKKELITRAAPGADRGASLQPGPTPKNRNLSPGQRLAQNLQREGVALS